MMRPKTVVRLLISCLVVWLALACLWLFLPSPSRHDNSINYPSAVINAGKKLTRVYRLDSFFPGREAHHEPVARARATNRWRFGLTFELDATRQLLTICDSQVVAIQNVNPDERVSPPFDVLAPTGDLDGVDPPWFAVADATLLWWELHRETAVMTLRATWSEGGTLEIWPDAESWSRGLPPHGIRPLLTVSVVSSAYSDNNLIVSAPPLSLSPTATFRARVILFRLLVPTGLLFLSMLTAVCGAVASFLIVTVKATVGGTVLLAVAWIIQGRPSPGPFFESLRGDLFRIRVAVSMARRGEGVRGRLDALDRSEKGQSITGKEKG